MFNCFNRNDFNRNRSQNSLNLHFLLIKNIPTRLLCTWLQLNHMFVLQSHCDTLHQFQVFHTFVGCCQMEITYQMNDCTLQSHLPIVIAYNNEKNDPEEIQHTKCLDVHQQKMPFFSNTDQHNFVGHN